MSTLRLAIVLGLTLLAAPVRAQGPAAELGHPVDVSTPTPVATPLAAPAPAATLAAGTSEGPSFALDLSVATTLPLVAGGTMGLEVPGHVVFRVGGGVVPSAYVDAINSVGVGWGVYGDDSARMASALLASAMWLEVGLGIRPAGTPGIELAVSYVLLWSQTHLDMSQFGLSARQAGLDLTVDAVHGELAWQSEPIEHVFLRIALGWAHAFDHHATLAAAGSASDQAALHAAADGISATVGRYAFGPTFGVSLGMRLW